MEVSFVEQLEGHKEPIYSFLDFDENHFLSASGDGIVAKWNIHDFSSVALAKSNSGIYAMCHLPDQFLAIGNNRGLIHFLDVNNKEISKNLKISGKPVFSLTFSEKTNKLYSAAGDGKISVIDVAGKSVEKQINISKKNLRSIKLNKAENLMSIGSSDHQIYIFSLPELNLISRLTESDNSVFCTQFISETLLVSGGRDAHLRLWDVIDQKELKSIPAHFFTINDLAFSPDRQWLATASRDKSFKIWEKTNLELKKVVSQEKFPEILRYSLNSLLWKNEYIITGGDDRLISIWQVKSA